MADGGIEDRGGTPPAGEELVRVRCGAWRLLVPMRHVERVHAAALPALQPSAGAPGAPMISVGGALVPVVFAEALLGATEVGIAPEHQMLLLREGVRSAFLWVDAVEEVVEHAPAAAPAARATSGDLVAGWSGADRPLAVLDVPALLSSVA